MPHKRYEHTQIHNIFYRNAFAGVIYHWLIPQLFSPITHSLTDVYVFIYLQAHGETPDVLMRGMQVGMLIEHEGPLQDAFSLKVFNVAVVVDERLILHDIRDVPTGFAMLLGVIYCLNLEYPRNMRYAFEFLQKVIMSIKPDQYSARVHGLQNKLHRFNL